MEQFAVINAADLKIETPNEAEAGADKENVPPKVEEMSIVENEIPNPIPEKYAIDVHIL